MSRVRVAAFSVSLDGYGAGPDQSVAAPLGVGGESLHEWVVDTRTFLSDHGGDAPRREGVDDAFASRAMAGLGA